MSHCICDDAITTHNNSLANLIRGVGERVLFTDSACTPCVKPSSMDVFEQRCGVYSRTMANGLGFQSPVTRQDFVGYYKGRRNTLYQKAVDGLAVMPVRVLDSRLSTFVKSEKSNFTLKFDPAPRVIQPRRPRYNVEVGRYLRPAEHKIYDEIDKLFGSPTIMSKYNAVEQARIIVDKMTSFRSPVCVGLDASRFDQHVSVQALRFEHSFYDMLFRSKHLRRLLSWQINNIGYARAVDGSFKYTTSGSRMSGDMNTSLGNKFLMCLMAKSYIDTKMFRIEFVNNGDDCLMFMEAKNLKSLSDLKSYFNDFGFKIVTEKPVYEVEHIEFCQCKPLLSNGVWRMVRNVRTCLLKDVTAVNLGHDLNMYQAWLGDVANCGLAFSSDVPVLGRFYSMLKRFGRVGDYHDKEASFGAYHTLSHGVQLSHSKPDAYGRYSFWKQTGIHPDAQVEIENYFDSAVWGDDKRQFISKISRIITHGT